MQQKADQNESLVRRKAAIRYLRREKLVCSRFTILTHEKRRITPSHLDLGAYAMWQLT